MGVRERPPPQRRSEDVRRNAQPLPVGRDPECCFAGPPSGARSLGTRPCVKRSLACVGGPVSPALMSGLLRGTCRWPSWVCACVSGAKLFGVLGAHASARPLPETARPAVLPITPFSACRRIVRAFARRPPCPPPRHPLAPPRRTP